LSFLIDTNIVSEIRRKSPHPGVLAWYASTPSERLFLSVLTVGQIRRGIERKRSDDPPAAASLERWYATLVDQYSERIIAIDAHVSDMWGQISALRPLPVVDALLAATALVHGLTLVTRNVSDVAGTGVPILDPFVA